MVLSPIETVLFALLAIMTLPDLLRRWGKANLLLPAYIILGLGMGHWLEPSAAEMLREVGGLGFILLLFGIGMEIHLPAWSQLRRPAFNAGAWFLAQAPLAYALAEFSGFSPTTALTAAVALCGVSVGMVHGAWHTLSEGTGERGQRLLLSLVTLEILAIAFFAAEEALLHAHTWGATVLSLALVLLLVGLLAVGANHFTALVSRWTEHFTLWKTHLLVFAIFAVAAVGERFGLSGAKTAFFIGLFVNKVQHDGHSLREALKPVGDRLLIPLFFVSLGARLDVSTLVDPLTLYALGSAAVLLASRYLLFPWMFGRDWPRRTAWLFAPNLSMAAVAVGLLGSAPGAERFSSWLLLTALVMSVAGLLFSAGRSETRAEDADRHRP